MPAPQLFRQYGNGPQKQTMAEKIFVWYIFLVSLVLRTCFQIVKWDNCVGRDSDSVAFDVVSS